MFLTSALMLAGVSLFTYTGTSINPGYSTKNYYNPNGTTFPNNQVVSISCDVYTSNLSSYGGIKNYLTYQSNNQEITTDFINMNYEESSSGYWLTWNIFGRYNYILSINLKFIYTSSGVDNVISIYNSDFIYLLNENDHATFSHYFNYDAYNHISMNYSLIPLNEDIYNYYSEFLDNDYYEQGYDNGYEVGYDNGYQDSRNDWHDIVYHEGYQDGINDYKDFYYDSGFHDGEIYGMEEANRDALIANQIFTGIISIALVPVNFFLGILNFDVFGINIGALVSSLLTVLVLITIIKTIFGSKSGGTE